MAENIISFIEHPTDSTKIIAATSKQLVEINNHGDCTVVAGVQLQGCLHTRNSLLFASISHIVYAHFTDLNTDHFLFNKSVILVADEGDHCIKFFDFEQKLLFSNLQTYNIGTCGLPQLTPLLAGKVRYFSDPQAITLNTPKYLSLYHDSETIRLVVNCVLTEVYSVIVSIYSTHTIAYEYSGHPGYITNMLNHFDFPLMKSQGFRSMEGNSSLAQVILHIEDNFGTLIRVYSYSCESTISSEVPRLLNDLPTILISGKVRYLIYNQISQGLLIQTLQVLNLPLEAESKLSQYTVARDSLILYSQSLKTFYFTKIYSQYQRVSESQCSQSIIQKLQVNGAESCAYVCFKYGYICVSFSFNSVDNFCYIHNEVSNTSFINTPGIYCYTPFNSIF